MPQIQFNTAFRTNDAVLQENSLKTTANVLDGAKTYLFSSNPPSAASFSTSGNNVVGTLYSFDAAGNVISAYEGEISRQIKDKGQVEAFQFYVYPSKDGNLNSIPSETILLDVGSQPLIGGADYKTSSDFKPSSLNDFITKNPTVTPPKDIDTTPDPTDGTVDVVPQRPGDERPDEITQLNTKDGDKVVIDVKDPDGKPIPEDTKIFVSDDGGETWDEHKPGDEITAGKDDLLVVIDKPKDPGPHDFPAKEVILVVDPGTKDEIDISVKPVDDTPIPGGPDTTPDPTDKPIDILPPEEFNSASPDAIVELNTKEGEKFKIDVVDKPPPGSDGTTGLDNTDIYYSTDNGKHWDEYTPGKEIVAGKDDVLVAVDITKEKYEGDGKPQKFELVATSEDGTKTSTFVEIVDDGKGTITKDITADTVNYSGANVTDAPKANGLAVQYLYDDHGSVCGVVGVNGAHIENGHWFV